MIILETAICGADELCFKRCVVQFTLTDINGLGQNDRNMFHHNTMQFNGTTKCSEEDFCDVITLH